MPVLLRLNGMAVGTEHFAFSNLGFNLYPAMTHHRSNVEGFGGAVQVVEVQGGWVGFVSTTDTTLCGLDLINFLPVCSGVLAPTDTLTFPTDICESIFCF